MALKTYYTNGDSYDANSVNWVNGCIENSVAYTYSGNLIGSMVETVSGSTITTRFVYTNVDNIGSIIETRDSKTITTVLTYSGGVIISTARL